MHRKLSPAMTACHTPLLRIAMAKSPLSIPAAHIQEQRGAKSQVRKALTTTPAPSPPEHERSIDRSVVRRRLH